MKKYSKKINSINTVVSFDMFLDVFTQDEVKTLLDVVIKTIDNQIENYLKGE